MLPSRLELKRPEGYLSNEAPLAKVNFTTALYVSPVQMVPGVLPHRNPSPLPFLDYVGASLFDEILGLGKGRAPPITQFLDSLHRFAARGNLPLSFL